MSVRATSYDPEPTEPLGQLPAELRRQLGEYHARISEYASTVRQADSAPVAGPAARAPATIPSADALVERLLQAKSILTLHLAAAQRADERYVLLAVDEMLGEVADGLELMAGHAGHGGDVRQLPDKAAALPESDSLTETRVPLPPNPAIPPWARWC
jgi:hypothetical protein